MFTLIYKHIIKRVLFKMDPEKTHDRAIKAGTFYGKHKVTRKLLSLFFNYKHQALVQTVDNITYQNPIGLAAGFDKDADLMLILPSIGFGFEEIGSVTAEQCHGNPKPRLWRIPKHKTLVVFYGLKNPGCREVAKKLSKALQKITRKENTKNTGFEFPLGISIAKTNCKETVKTQVGINDYYRSFITLEPYANYITINISCPNAYGGQPFTTKELLKKLFTKLDKIKTKKPVYVKVSPDLSKEQIDTLINIANKHNIQGFIISNLLKNREKSSIPKEEFDKVGTGGLSGKAVEQHANERIQYVYKKTKGKFTIIGCGGVFTAEDAYKKIKAGASLIQLISGMIFEGPQVIKKINKGLVKLLKKDGFTNISEAVGMDHKR